MEPVVDFHAAALCSGGKWGGGSSGQGGLTITRSISLGGSYLFGQKGNEEHVSVWGLLTGCGFPSRGKEHQEPVRRKLAEGLSMGSWPGPVCEVLAGACGELAAGRGAPVGRVLG